MIDLPDDYKHEVGTSPVKEAVFTGEDAPHLRFIDLAAEQLLAKSEDSGTQLFFLLEGSLLTSPNNEKETEQTIQAPSFFLVPESESFYARTHTPTELCCLHLCTQCIQILIWNLAYIQPDKNDRSSHIPALPIAPQIVQELHNARQTLRLLQRGKNTYLKHKAHTILALIRGTYEAETCAGFFAPLQDNASGFRQLVLKNYHNIRRVKDLIQLLHMPPTSFNRKFHETFHTSAREWFADRRRKDLWRDIVFSTMTLYEVADKYELTPNHLMKLCKDSFGMTFTGIRKSYQPRNRNFHTK